MIELLLAYLLVVGSFSISSYFFIHLPALKKQNLKNDIAYSISYIIISTIHFPRICRLWFKDHESLKEALYSEDVPA